MGKEPELVEEVERYRLDIVGLTSTHSSGTKILDRGWSLSYSGVDLCERPQAGVGILTSPRLGAAQLEFVPVDDRVAWMRLRVFDCCVCICAKQQLRVSGLLGEGRYGARWGAAYRHCSLTRRLQRTRRERWRYLEGEGVIGKNGLSNLKLSGEL